MGMLKTDFLSLYLSLEFAYRWSFMFSLFFASERRQLALLLPCLLMSLTVPIDREFLKSRSRTSVGRLGVHTVISLCHSAPPDLK